MPGSARTPSPFDVTAHKTERSAAAVLMHWMRQIIEESNLDLGLPDVETGATDRKMPDLVIYASRRSTQVLCVIEVKPPSWDVFDHSLKDDARKKANVRAAPYFATTNFRSLVWWNTAKANKPAVLEEEQIVDHYQLSAIVDLNEVEQTRFSDPIRRALTNFLTRLYAVYARREVEPRLAIDELLVFRLHERIRILAGYYREIIRDKCHKDKGFARQLASWFNEQSWSFNWQDSDYDKAARQAAYLLVNKILFYHALQAKRPNELDPLVIPEGLTKGGVLQRTLEGYFDEVLKIDYETIYTADFIDSIAFPDNKEVVAAVTGLVTTLRRYDFSKLGYDVVGRIFERLIPQQERHILGQYFTDPDVVDLILRFCLQHEDDMVLDPSCGAGTFLVRAYQHKRLKNQRLGHERILETLWGNDIAKFPAHLSTINLAICDLGVDQNYPNIIQEDFFALQVGSRGFELPERTRKRRAMTLGKSPREVTYPGSFDVIVGNPPYTRQEEIPVTGVDKVRLIRNALLLGNRRLADISRRAGIHAYFFVHGFKFLRDGGRFGFVVSNSWLDVDYGKGLQEFFLKNYRIVAIIESKVERWFEDADINTCIVILEKCADKEKRDSNLVRFVYLKKPLRQFIPPAQDIWEQQLERLRAIDRLRQTILAHDNLYENEELRVFPVRQSELWAEGYDADEGKFVGAKWGKYLRAPEIFFRILEKGKGKLVPLKQIAQVRRGFTTGANEFFYLTEEQIRRWGIEREFWMHKDEKGRWVPNYVIKSPRECRSILVKPEALKYRVLLIHKDKDELKGTNVLRYIQAGERKGYHKRPTCAARKRWYDLGERQAGAILFAMIQAYRHIIVYNPRSVYPDHNLFEVLTRRTDSAPIAAYLSSAVTMLMKEVYGRSYGGGSGPLKAEGIDIERLPVLSPAVLTVEMRKMVVGTFQNLTQSTLQDTFSEIGAENPGVVSLDKVKPDRRELDRIIMGEILGLTEEEQLEVYRAVIDLVRARIERAKSIANAARIRDGVDIELFTDGVVKQVREGSEP